MDPLSTVTSVLTLLDALKGIVKVAHTIYTRLENAPQDLLQLRQQVMLLAAELTQIESTTRQVHEKIASPDVQVALLKALLDARDGVGRIDDICLTVRYLHDSRALGTRFRWALVDRKRVAEALLHVEAARQSLRDLMQLVSFTTSILVFRHLEDAVAGKTVMKSISPTRRQNFKQPHPRSHISGPVQSGAVWRLIGVDFKAMSSSRYSHKDYDITAWMKLPLPYFLGRYAILLNLSVRLSPYCYGISLLSGSSFSLARPLPDDAPFFKACEDGNLITVRAMLDSGEGRLTDHNEMRRTPIALAIMNGRMDIVREFLRCGIDVDSTFGINRTSPLQWAVWRAEYDIAKLLLEHGASQDHVSYIGWNTVFFCWPNWPRPQHLSPEKALDLVRLLSEDSIQALDVVDVQGWTCLHRVSAYGTSSEVNELIRLGADPRQVALPLRWTAIHHAAFYGNHDAFQALIPYFNDLLTLTDERGWSLLHIVASANHQDLVRDLISRGADVQALTRPFASHMPEILFHRKCTPLEVAAAQGEKVASKYLQTLDDLGMDVFFDAETEPSAAFS